uniref:Uncharacterized protein n=1 Tax=Aegilops tauschii subsp. strangulata TaxID=200361 RepID=A0A453Q5U3_AEGTS
PQHNNKQNQATIDLPSIFPSDRRRLHHLIMARRGGFFGYDPYDYYYPSSYGYEAYPYYADPFFLDAQPLVTERLRPARRRAPAQHDGGFFPGFGAAEPAARTTAHPRPSSGSPKSCPDCFEVEVTGPDSDSPPAIPKKT